MEKMTKQQMLDKTPASNYEAVLQNMLYGLSKTKLEQIRRVFAELDRIALYKTQYRALTFIEVFTAISEAVKLNKDGNEKDTMD